MFDFLKLLLPGNNKQRLTFVAVIFIAFIVGWMMSDRDTIPLPVSESKSATTWTCSMHPQIQQPESGQCPICGMDLIPVQRDNDANVGPHRIALSDRARKLTQIQVAPVERRYVETKIRLVGKIDFDETGLAYITAWVPGRIDRMYVDYTGISVWKGDHMVELYSPEIISTLQELLQTIHSVNQTNAAMLQKNIQSIRERLRLWGLTAKQIKNIEESGTVPEQVTISTPMSGVVIARDGLEGMYVDKGTRLYTIADLSTVWLFLEAYESDIQWLRYGQDVVFTTEAYPGEEFRGKIAFIDPVLDDQTRTVKIRVNVSNRDKKLKPGMFVRAYVHSQIAAGGKVIHPDLSNKWICPMHPEVVKTKPGACDICGMSLVKSESLGYVSASDVQKTASLVIPATAPLITGKRAIVYVQLPGQEGVFEGREIILGPRSGDYYIVETGLEEGELIVTQGNFKIDSAIQIQAGPSMMNPGAGSRTADHKHLTPPEKEKQNAQQVRTDPDISPVFYEQLDQVYNAYFEIRFALSHDEEEKMRSGAADMLVALNTVNSNLSDKSAHRVWKNNSKALEERAEKLQRAPDIMRARIEFKHLSEIIIKIAENFGSSGKQPLLVYHCPMAFNNEGADWLQNKEGVENPYFGARMFKCGSQELDLTHGLVRKAGHGTDE